MRLFNPKQTPCPATPTRTLHSHGHWKASTVLGRGGYGSQHSTKYFCWLPAFQAKSNNHKKEKPVTFDKAFQFERGQEKVPGKRLETTFFKTLQHGENQLSQVTGLYFLPLVFQSSLPPSPMLPNGGSTLLKWPGRNLSPPCAGGRWVDLSTSGHACNLRLSRANAGSAATFPESWSSDLPSPTHPSPVPLLNSIPATLGHGTLTKGAAPPHRPCLDSSHRPQSRGFLFRRLKGGQGEEGPDYKPDIKITKANSLSINKSIQTLYPCRVSLPSFMQTHDHP